MSGPNTSRMRSENGFEHKGGLCVTGVSVHEATNSGPSGDAIEVADRALQAGDHRQCREPGGLLRRLERESLGTLPKGPVGVPSGSGPWPDTKARFPRMRTHSNEMVTPGGSFGLDGSVNPSSSSRSRCRW